jgi:glycosyltransferase involved in cell wall biosynthesis
MVSVSRTIIPRKVLAFPLGGQEVPSSRLRLHCYADRFRAAGVAFEFYQEGATDVRARLRNLYHFLTADIFFVQKQLFGPRRIRLSHWLNKRIVYDIDDATFVDQTTGAVDQRAYQALMDFLQHCDLIVLCNEFLKEHLVRPGQPSLNLATVPPYRPPVRAHRVQGLPRFGWVGTVNNLAYLAALDPVFCDLQSRYPFELVVVCGRSAQAPLRARHRYIPWDLEIDRRLADLFDVGLMPLPDDDWTRGKCGYKIIQYQSLGLPAIASPVGINTQLIEHGVTGFLADDADQWRHAMQCLLQEPALAEAMSARILQQYPERFCVERNFERLFAAMCAVLG